MSCGTNSDAVKVRSEAPLSSGSNSEAVGRSGFRRALVFSQVLVLVFAFVALSSCNNPFTKKGEESAADQKLKGVTVSLNGNAEPSVQIPEDLKIDVQMSPDGSTPMNVFDVVNKGTGEPLKDGQNAKIGYSIYTMPSREKQYSSWEEDGGGRSFPMYPNSDDPNDLYKVLSGLNVGAVVVQAIPGQKPQDDSSSTSGSSDSSTTPSDPNSFAGGQNTDTSGTYYTIMVLYIEDVTHIKTRADGTDVPASSIDAGLPKVTLAENGAPSIEIPKDYQAPEDLVIQPLKTGDGPKITADDTVSFAYTAWKLDGTKLESTWDTGRFVTFTLNMSTDGWKKGLEGATIGSQVLLVVPAAADKTGAPASSPATIFVIDILGII
jgi:peptidylprolyl isomerase